jgi:D-arabinonate dehydratase/D-galactarolactone cycloisomerase
LGTPSFRDIDAAVNDLGRVSDARGLVIEDVEVILLSHRVPDDRPLAWSGGLLPGVTAGLVRVRTTDGLTGLGETYAGQFAPEVVQELVNYYRPLIVGQDASDITGIWQRCYTRTLYWGRSGISVSVLSAIESALWDLVGKALGTPVHRLLGGRGRDRIDTYASGGMDAPDDELAGEQRHYVEAGYRASKIRIGASEESDLHKTSIARSALGPDVRLAVDAVQGSNPNPWDAATAIRVGRRLEACDLLWYEEPCAADDLDGYVKCRRALNVPIAGGETRTTAKEFVPLFEAGAVDVVQPDAAHIGGILEAVKVTQLAAAAGVQIAMHAWSSGVGVMANAHVAFGAEACHWMEYPTVGNPLVEGLMRQPLRIVDGQLSAPEGPGLGVDIPPDLEERHRYRPSSHYEFQERR